MTDHLTNDHSYFKEITRCLKAETLMFAISKAKAGEIHCNDQTMG